MVKLILVFLFFFSLSAFGQAVDPVTVPPEWFVDSLKFLAGLPKVGPAIAVVVKWAVVLSGLLTAVSLFLMALKKALEATKWFVKIDFLEQKVSFWISVILPYVKWFSMFNVQKSELPKIQLPVVPKK